MPSRVPELCVVLIAVVVSCSRAEPIVDGRSTGQWVEELAASEAARRVAACRALGTMGASAPSIAVEALERALGDPSAEVHNGAEEALLQIGGGARVAALRAFEADLEGAMPYTAAVTLGRLGAAARPAIPLLEKALAGGDWALRLRAAEALVRIGGEGKTTALKWLSDELASPRENSGGRVVAEVLGELGPDAAPAAPVLVRALRSDNPRLATTAAEALGHLGPASDEEIQALQEMLFHSDNDAGVAAAAALAKLSSETPRALTVLKEAAVRSGPIASSRAAWALAEMGPEERRLAIPVLTRAAVVGGDIDELASRFGDDLMPALVAILRGADPVYPSQGRSMVHLDYLRGVRRCSASGDSPAGVVGVADLRREGWAETIGVAHWGVNQLVLLPARRCAVTGTDVVRPRQVMIDETIARPCPDVEDAVCPLLPALLDGRALPRVSAAYALGKLGRRAKAYVATLADAIADQNLAVAVNAAYALGEIGPDASTAAPVLSRYAQSGAAPLAEVAEEALRRIRSTTHGEGN